VPIIEVKAFERRFQDEERSRQLIARLTDAIAEVYGEELRAETWVLLEGFAPARWGFAGEVRT
jgi:4-oxalocrotonate tautomerase